MVTGYSIYQIHQTHDREFEKLNPNKPWKLSTKWKQTFQDPHLLPWAHLSGKARVKEVLMIDELSSVVNQNLCFSFELSAFSFHWLPHSLTYLKDKCTVPPTLLHGFPVLLLAGHSIMLTQRYCSSSIFLSGGWSFGMFILEYQQESLARLRNIARITRKGGNPDEGTICLV